MFSFGPSVHTTFGEVRAFSLWSCQGRGGWGGGGCQCPGTTTPSNTPRAGGPAFPPQAHWARPGRSSLAPSVCMWVSLAHPLDGVAVAHFQPAAVCCCSRGWFTCVRAPDSTAMCAVAVVLVACGGCRSLCWGPRHARAWCCFLGIGLPCSCLYGCCSWLLYLC